MTPGSLWKSTFVWVALLAIVAVAVVTLVPWPTGREPAQTGAAPDAAPVTSDPVADYLTFADRLGDPAVAADDGVVVDGLRRLAGAVAATAADSPDLPVDLRVAAEHVVLNPDAPGTAALMRERFVAVAAALERGDGRGALRQSAEALDAAQPITAQRERVIDFFRRAAETLRRSHRPAA